MVFRERRSFSMGPPKIDFGGHERRTSLTKYRPFFGHFWPFFSLGWVGWGERDSQNRSDWLGNHEAVRVWIEGPWCEGRCREGEGTAAGRMRRDVQEDRRRVQGEGR